MKNIANKIVVLTDYRKAREQLELKDIEEIITYGQNGLRDIDRDTSTALMKKHKLKDTEKLRKELAEINSILLETSNWLEDESIQADDTQKGNKIEQFRKLNSQLLARSETTRKILVDDMAASRYYEQRWLLDPAKLISFGVITPVAVAAFVDRFIDIKNHIGVYVGEVTIPLGLYLAFKSHADNLFMTAHKQMKKAPANIRAIAVTSALEFSVRSKPLNDIQPRFPQGRAHSERVIIELKR